MPIYAYQCSSCGHRQDVLQKMSDPLLTTCPACGEQTYTKQVTAAGFQLKGSGWYVTDFRGGNTAKPDATKPADAKPDAAAAPAAAGAEAAKPAASEAPKPAAPPAPSPPPAADGA